MNVIGPPTQDGFLSFVRTVAGIPSGVLPDNALSLPFAFEFAMDVVNLQLAQASPDFYTLAVYNLGVDNLINYAPDVADAPPYNAPENENNLPYFAYFRWKWKIYDFTPGVVQSSGDEGTSVSLLVQEAAKNFKLADLQNLKTPFGRQYLAIAQRCGTNWGLT